jgi:starch synthase
VKVLFVTPELAPLVKTGGLGDVADALPRALRAAGVDVRLLAPRYPALQAAFPDAEQVAAFDSFGAHFSDSLLLETTTPEGMPLWLLDCPGYFRRPGSPYVGPEGHDWQDNHLRFGLLSRVAAWFGSEENFLDWKPDVIHCNDWQTGLAPAYLKLLPGGRARSLITVHNLAFQGLFAPATLHPLGLPATAWSMDGIEYYGHLSFLKAGLRFADAITTVSPNYAREIQTDEQGMGLGGLLRHRTGELTGILNGIDTVAWNPAADASLVSPYDARHLDGKRKNRAALQQELGLAAREDLPVVGIVSRLTYQKGLDLIPLIGAALAAMPVQMAVLGSGEKVLEEAFADLARKHPGQFAVTIGFDEGMAHRIEAGADMFLMPSRFEPCGLNQMYSLRYGTPPIVRATGGLADTVEDGITGFIFAEPTSAELLAAIRRAVEAWHDKPRWLRMQRNGMERDFGWAAAARQYVEVLSRL